MPTAIQREAQAIKTEARKILLIVVCICLVVYAFTGTAQVGQEQTGLVIRFGSIVNTLKPGLHRGYPWPIDKVVRIPTGVSHSLAVRNFNLPPQQVSDQKALFRRDNRFKQALRGHALSSLTNPYLITADLNVVHLDLVVVYNISDPKAYYRAAGDVLDVSRTNIQLVARKVVANALIRTVGQMEIMDVLGQGQVAIQRRVRLIAQQQFDQLELGITIRQADGVRITNARVPAPLQEVFNSVTTAMQAGAELINSARVEYERIINEAKAKAAEINADAQAYAEATDKQAQGDAKRYKALINEYHREGEVVRDRLRYEKLAQIAPYLKAPTMYAIENGNGKQKLVVTIPGKPE